jgi:Ca-activated chloride channel family protein
MSFHLAHPAALILLVPALLVPWAERRWGGQLRARFKVSSVDLLGGRRGDGLAALAVLRAAALAMLVVAFARPQWGQAREEITAPATDIMLVLDSSGSMQALDFAPKNRLDAAKDALRRFIEARPRDRLGLVVFASMAFTQCPLTLDHGALLEFLERVKIGMIPEDRTAIGSAVATAAARLKNSEAKSKVMVLLTDGRNNAGAVDPVTAARAAGALGIKMYVVGAGAPGGADFPVDDPVFGRRLVHTEDDLDEDTLRKIADATQGRYFRATDLDSLRKVYGEIDRLEKTDVKTETFADYKDAYFPWLLAGMLLFLTELGLSHTALRRIP